MLVWAKRNDRFSKKTSDEEREHEKSSAAKCTVEPSPRKIRKFSSHETSEHNRSRCESLRVFGIKRFHPIFS